MSTEYPDIPGYEIREVLGRGGFASVYLARQILLDRLVALKVMDPALARDREFCERFVREARDTAGLGDHRAIVTVYDIGRVGDVYYIAMQYLPGPNLKELLDADEPYQHPLHIVGRIADALNHAHARGFVHRDIKPANILFDEANEAILSDFGIAKSLGRNTQLTTVGAIIGTARYMSPEQAKGLSSIDCRSDLYSLGVVLFELLTGAPPYNSPDPMTLMLQHVNEPVPTLPESEAIYQPLIDKLMAKNPDDRYSCGDELIADIARHIDAQVPTSHGVPSTGGEGGHVNRPLIVVGAAAAASALVGVYMLIGGGEDTRLGPETAPESPVVSAPDAFVPDAAVLDAVEVDVGALDAGGANGADATASSGVRTEAFDGPDALAGTSDAIVPDAAARDAAGLGQEDDDAGSSDLAVANTSMSDSELQRLERLLDIAELHELVGRIAEPPGANAIDAYALALEIDPGNALARDALTRLRATQ